MDTNRSGDHHQVQTAVGRAVSGDPPSAAAAMASSLPPLPPSASDATVQPRTRDGGSSADPPQSTATRGDGERPSDNEENNSRVLAAPSDGSIDAVLPPLASCAAAGGAAAATPIGVVLDRMEEEDAPVPPAQIAADFERMDAATNELKTPPDIEDVPMRPLDDMDEEDAPVPPAQIDADFERMDVAINDLKKTPPNIEDVPMHPSQIIATDFDDEDKAIEVPQIVQQEEEETLQQAQDPPTPAVTRAPSPPPMDRGRSPSNPGGPQQIPVRPPPQSMMPSPDEDADPPVSPVSALPHDPSVPRLSATLVEDQPEIPVFDAVQVAEPRWLSKKTKYIFGGLGLLIGAVTAGVSVSSNNASSDSDTIEPEGIVLSPARPSQSSSSSEVPSLQSTARPSESSSPSQFPSLRPTLRPSQSSDPSQSPSRSLRPSFFPSTSASPTPFCFGGEINILTDEYPEETSWTISRIDDVDGVANSEVVLEGAPDEVGNYTSGKVCLERGDYDFAILDSVGDGISSPGYYSVTFDGVMIANGREFGSEERVSFSLPLPSPQPSESSSPSKLPSASFQPSGSIAPSQFPSFRSSVQPSISFSPSTYYSKFSWNRQSTGLYGEESKDYFGIAVTAFGAAVVFSADALIMAVGGPGAGPGYVKVYHREGEGSSWEQRGETIHGEANGDYFGASLAISDDGTALSIGAPFHDSVGLDSGLVKVYEWDEAALNYLQIGDTLYGAASGDEFGWSLDISNGMSLAVGARYSDANGSESGQVTIYAWDEASSNYKQRGQAINGAALDFFGSSVSLAENGQKLAVGAYGNDSNGDESGQVRIFEWDEDTSNYEQLGDSLLGDAVFDSFGVSVSFSRDGMTLAVGAPFSNKNGFFSGQVKVFAWDERASNFEQLGQSLYGKAEDFFGASVALSDGKTLAIGATQSWNGKPGYVEVYEWDETAREYKQLGQSLGGKASEDNFGFALALAGNGRVLTVGAPGNDGNGTDSGLVEVFNIEL